MEAVDEPFAEAAVRFPPAADVLLVLALLVLALLVLALLVLALLVALGGISPASGDRDQGRHTERVCV